VSFSAQCHKQAVYAECRYAECHFAQCRGANPFNQRGQLLRVICRSAIPIIIVENLSPKSFITVLAKLKNRVEMKAKAKAKAKALLQNIFF
jgi:hypothetical protein